MSLPPELRKLLMDGPDPYDKGKGLIRYGGPASVLVARRRHREELMAACPTGKRPYAFWMVERRLKQRPGGEVGELRAIRQFELYRDEEERAYVERRLAEIMAGIRTRRASPQAAPGWPKIPRAPRHPEAPKRPSATSYRADHSVELTRNISERAETRLKK